MKTRAFSDYAESVLPVMPGLVPGIHVFRAAGKDVDGRDKPGHDEWSTLSVSALARAPDHIAARKLLDAGKSPTFAQAGDEAFALAALLR